MRVAKKSGAIIEKPAELKERGRPRGLGEFSAALSVWLLFRAAVHHPTQPLITPHPAHRRGTNGHTQPRGCPCDVPGRGG